MTDTTRTHADAMAMIHRFGDHDADDLIAARAIATAAIKIYGDFDAATYAKFEAYGIWNDHAAVQAALAAIRLSRGQ